MPPVTIRVLTDDPSPTPVQGVVVEFYSTGAIFQTGGTSDSSGEVTVTLPDADYDVLFYKVGVSILPKQPQRITVDSLLTNTFEVTGHIRARPESIDPRLITISGRVMGIDGKQDISRLIFEPVTTITVLDKMVVAPYHRREVSSNVDGYFEFELLRDTKYSAYFLFPQDLFGQPGKLDVITPDTASVDLDALLFPIPIDFIFSELSISLVSGGPNDESVDFDLSYSDSSSRETFSTPWAYVSLTNTDNKIVEATLRSGGKLCLKPITPGVATITTQRSITDRAFFDPLPSYTTNIIVVTVT